MLIVSIILIIISITLIIFSIYSMKHTHKINTDIDIKNHKLEEDYNNLKQELSNKQKELFNYEEQLKKIQDNITKSIDNREELSKKAFENYCQVLEKNYEEKEQEYDKYEESLNTAYSNLQLKLIKELDEAKAELASIEATRAAAIQAQIKEKEIEEQLSFYCLTVSDNELKDISVLESIKPKLFNPRILSMLIWKTFYQKPMTDLCNQIIGTDVKTGIYKITNQKTKECYIGQAVDLATRWKTHAKCGLGIDTPPGNLLYKSMQDYGIWNFSWEVLEFCPREKLDEKENYYIQLYQSKDYGYNSNKGITKKE